MPAVNPDKRQVWILSRIEDVWRQRQGSHRGTLQARNAVAVPQHDGKDRGIVAAGYAGRSGAKRGGQRRKAPGVIIKSAAQAAKRDGDGRRRDQGVSNNKEE